VDKALFQVTDNQLLEIIMEIEATYNKGKLEFPSHVKLRTQYFRVKVEIPDEAIVTNADSLPEYSLEDFPEAVQEEVSRMQEIRESVMAKPIPSDLPEETEKQKDRREAFELREAIRLEQGRPV